MDENGTLTPPLVLFKHYGSSYHHGSPQDSRGQIFKVAEIADKKAKKERIPPSYLGRSQENAGRLLKDQREQELRWLELSKQEA